MPSLINHLYRFGEFSLDPQGRVLRRGGEAVSLTPKAFDALLVLVQNAGRTVTKDELMEAVWPGSFVEESNLTQTIFMVRKALDETADRRYILTVQSQGYRFLVQVTEAPVAEGPVTEAASGEPETEEAGVTPKPPAPPAPLRSAPGRTALEPAPTDGREVQSPSHPRSVRRWRSA